RVESLPNAPPVRPGTIFLDRLFWGCYFKGEFVPPVLERNQIIKRASPIEKATVVKLFLLV
ncbi:MAG: hypothetical protein WAV56_00460, partial [Microgenomates group bacterium]